MVDLSATDRGLADLDQDTLVARAQDGDLDAFERLVDLYSGPLFRLAVRMVNDREEAEDIVQETLIAAWRRLPMLEHPGAFGGWAYRVATNRCLDLIKQRSGRKTDAVDADTMDRVDHGGAGPEQLAERSAQANDLERLLMKLAPVQRACWLLREVHGRSYAEISGTLSVTEGAVRGQISRARQQLAKGMIAWR